MAQPAVPVPLAPATVVHGTVPTTSRFLLDETSHILVGVLAALAGVLGHRAPAGVVIEAVLAVDLVNST